MGSGDWIEKLKKASAVLSKSSSSGCKSHSERQSTTSANEAGDGTSNPLAALPEDKAAIRIQTTFRAYVARKALRCLKGMVRMRQLTEKFPVKRQATMTLSYLHSWSKIQSQVRAHRLCVVTEGGIREKKLGNQMKLEDKLHNLEVDWCGGSESKEEILSRIHQKEEAAIKRERAMAYAFNHQWRANSDSVRCLSYEVSKANWGAVGSPLSRRKYALLQPPLLLQNSIRIERKDY